MGAVISYIMRVVGYALLIGVPTQIGEYFWQGAALDQAEPLQFLHAIATTVVRTAPFLLAFFGFGRLRPLAVFIALYLAGAALTAPFALARFGAAI